MKKIFYTFLLIMLISCGKERQFSRVEDLNGYWRIVKAEIPEVIVKEYKGGLKLDYISLDEDSTGIRKKVKVSMIGKFKTTPNSQSIQLIQEDDEMKIKCKTPYSTWKENVIHLSKDSLVLKNQDDKLYFYKKYSVDEIK